MQRKHILLASKAKHSSTSQVKIRGYVKAKSCRQKIAAQWMTQYTTGNYVRLQSYVTCRDDSILEESRKMWPEILSGLLHDVYTMRSSQRSVATAAAAVMWQQFHPVSHILNMISFVQLFVRLLHWLYKLKPITSTREITWHLECGWDCEVHWNCKKNCRSFANGAQTIQKEGTTGHLTQGCIGCTSVVQCERTVVLRSAEMRNFSSAECGKAIRGNLRNVLHLIFR